MSEPQSRMDGTLHIWERHPKTGRASKWVGQWMSSPADAFKWMDQKGKGRDAYVLNNVPPVSGRMQNPTRHVEVSATGTRTDKGALPRKVIPGKTNRAPMTPAMQEQMTTKGKGYNRPKTASPIFGGRRTAAPQRARDNSPEAQRLRADAASALDQHKKDEAKDLAEGKNN